MEETTIRYFDILRCGYYLPRKKEIQFGGLSETLRELSKWGKSIDQIGNTKTYQADPTKDIRNTYFFDSHYDSTTGDYLLIFWNEIANVNGKVYGINPKSSPGSSKMLSTEFSEEKTIPGLPSYFWFIPKHNLAASIIFNHSMQGKNNMQNFLNGFLVNKSPYQVIGSDKKILGYSLKKPPSDGYEKISPHFHAISSKNSEVEAELLKKVSLITRMIKKEILDYQVIDDRSVIEKFFSGLLDNQPVFDTKRQVVHELQYTPSVAELKDMIDNFNQRTEDSNLHNVGFKLKGGKKIMLSGINISIPHQFNVSRRNDNEIIKAKSLMDAILAKRSQFLTAVIHEPSVS